IPYEEVKVLIEAMKQDIGLADSDFPDEYALLTWPMLQEISSAGITVGGHTCNHVLLTREPLESVEKEIKGSKEDLERMLGIRADHFAYPDGRYDDRVADLVRKAGFKSASTI